MGAYVMILLIAKQEGSNRYLFKSGPRKGFVADMDLEVKYNEFNIESLLARGYWNKVNNNKDIIKKVEEFPISKRTKKK